MTVNSELRLYKFHRTAENGNKIFIFLNNEEKSWWKKNPSKFYSPQPAGQSRIRQSACVPLHKTRLRFSELANKLECADHVKYIISTNDGPQDTWKKSTIRKATGLI